MGILGSALICVGVAAVSWPAKRPDATPPGTQPPSDLVEASKQSMLALQDYTILELSPVEEGEEKPLSPLPEAKGLLS